MASTPPLWGVHVAVPRTGGASPSVVEKPFREVGNGDSPSVSAQHISRRSHEKPCKSQTHPYCGPKYDCYLYVLYDLSVQNPRIAQKREHHFLELTFVILLITQKCDSLSRNSMDFEMLWYPLPRMKQLSRNAHRGILVSWTPNTIKYTSPTKWLSKIPLYHFMI